MIPSAGTRTMTRFGLVWPARKLRFDARGGEPWSPGYTVRKLGAVGSVTVTFIATATTPESGTPLRPVASHARMPLGPIGSLLSRVSKYREGASGWKRAPAGPEDSA